MMLKSYPLEDAIRILTAIGQVAMFFENIENGNFQNPRYSWIALF